MNNRTFLGFHDLTVDEICACALDHLVMDIDSGRLGRFKDMKESENDTETREPHFENRHHLKGRVTDFLVSFLVMLVAMGMADGQQLAAADAVGFEEEEGFSTQGELPSRVTTTGDVEATVVEGIAAAGSQSLRVEGLGTVLIAVGESDAAGPIFASFSLSGTLGAERNGNPRVSIGGAAVELSTSGSDVEVWIRHARGGSIEWINTGNTFSMEQTDWLRLTVRLDAAAGIWDLYQDDQPIGADIGLGAEQFAAIVNIESRGQVETLVDEVLIADENPLFEDADGDGVSDAFELTVGADPTSWDRNQVVGANGESLIEAYLGQGGAPSDSTPTDDFRGAAVSFHRKYGARSNPLLKLYEEEMTMEIFTPMRNEKVTLSLDPDERDESSSHED